MRDDCIICGWAPVARKGRCWPCYMWRRRQRRDRTEEEVVAYGRRIEGRMAPQQSLSR